jgi:predicted HD phosphohydrolase
MIAQRARRVCHSARYDRICLSYIGVSFVGAAKEVAQRALGRFGYRLQRAGVEQDRQRFRSYRSSVLERHDRQTRDEVARLNDKYREPIYGEVRVWELFPILARCIDPTDPGLGCVSQLTHTLQVIEAMQDDSISDADLLLCALVHDLGKVLLTAGEDPANVVGLNAPIGAHESGVGFDNCVFQWNHDEFGYSRFRDHVPDHVAWLIRYHSVHFALPEVQRVMDDRDKQYAQQYYRVFSRYDFLSKSIFGTPKTRIEDYRELIETTFPSPIRF